MSEPILPPLKPVFLKDRLSMMFIGKGQLDVLDGAFVIIDTNGVRTHIPVGSIACLLVRGYFFMFTGSGILFVLLVRITSFRITSSGILQIHFSNQ